MKQGKEAPAASSEIPPSEDPAKALATAQAEIERLTRLVQTNRVEEGRLRAATDEIKTLKEQVAALDAARTKRVEAGALESLTEEENTLLGELKAPILKAAREIVQQETAALLKPLDDRTRSLEAMSEAQYLAVLFDQVPGWEKQNDDPHFIAWLKQLDPDTQQTRDDLLQRANGARQGYRVAEIFLAFTEKREIRTPGAATPQPRNIDHGPGSGNPTPPEPEGAVITRAMIAQFYGERARGKYRGREKEAATLEAQINAAVSTGKVA